MRKHLSEGQKEILGMLFGFFIISFTAYALMVIWSWADISIWETAFLSLLPIAFANWSLGFLDESL